MKRFREKEEELVQFSLVFNNVSRVYNCLHVMGPAKCESRRMLAIYYITNDPHIGSFVIDKPRYLSSFWNPGMMGMVHSWGNIKLLKIVLAAEVTFAFSLNK